MDAVGFGVTGLMILLGFGGGMGFPLGIPPGPEDPLLTRVAPEECLYYTSWAGMAEPDPQSTNQVEQLLAEPEIRYLVSEIQRRVKAGVREAAEENEGPEAAAVVDDAARWLELLLTRPAVVFVSSVDFTPEGPDVRGGLLVALNDDAAAVKASLEKHQATFLDEIAEPVQINGGTWHQIKLGRQAPPITWGVRGRYLVVGVGEGEVEAIFQRAVTEPPAWLAAVRQQLTVERPATVNYVNLAKVIEIVTTLADEPQIRAVIDAAGLGDVTSLASVTGLDKDGFVSRTLVGVDGQPGGLFELVAGEPLAAADLAPIPRDATIALAARLDANHLLETFLAAATGIDPELGEEVNEGLDEMEEELGIDPREVLGPLGDVWCLYNSPSEGGLAVTGLTAVVQVKDHQRMAATHAKLLAIFKSATEQDTEYSSRRDPRIEQFPFAGQEIYFFNARDDEFPLAPSWCLTDRELIIALFPQNIKAYLTRDDDFQSLAEVPEVAALYTSGKPPVMLAYQDTRELFELVYPIVQIFAQMAAGELQREGIDVDISLLPSARSIGKHLRPGVTSVSRTEAGIELTSSQSLPTGSIGTTLPIAAAALLPAISSARGAAKRAQSMNNLKQLALAMHMYAMDHEKFPPAYSTDEDGKPLLSWRVHVLPYLENEGLYERFHLDEPWDSEHNKKLIPLMPALLRPAKSQAGPGKTNYLGVGGEDGIFPGTKAVRLADIRDGTSNTVMIVEASDQAAVVWTAPDDFQPDADRPIRGLVGLQDDGFLAAFADGSVRLINAGIDPDVLKALFTRSGGEVVRPRDLDEIPGNRGVPDWDSKEPEAMERSEPDIEVAEPEPAVVE